MTLDSGLSALPSPLSESISTLKPAFSRGEINDPIADGLALTSASSLSDTTAL